MSQTSFECPSYYCADCKYVFEEDRICPECKKQLTKCDYKTDVINADGGCPKCNNGIKWQARNKEIYKRYVHPIVGEQLKELQSENKPFFFSELGTASSDGCSSNTAPSAIEKLKEMIINDKLRRCNK